MKSLHSLLVFAVWFVSLALGHAQGTYVTDWVGNTNGTVANHVGNAARAMWVAPEGIVYTSSMWDESGRNIGIYQNGAVIGSMAGTNGSQGSAITGDATNLFTALQNPYAGYIGRYNRTSKVQDLRFRVSAASNTLTSDVITGLTDYNGEVYVSDFPGNRIQVYSTAGVLLRSIAVTQPGAIAIESGGANFWVAIKSTGTLRRFTSAGVVGSVIQMAATARPSSLWISPSSQLWVGDQGPDMNIKIYASLTGTPVLNTTYGLTGGYLSSSGAPIGTMGAKRFTRVVGIGGDTTGNIYVLNNPWGGTWDLGRNGVTDLHCYNSAGTLAWTAQALNFEGTGAPDPGTDGVDLYSGNLILTGSGGGGGKANTINPIKYPTDIRLDTTSADRGIFFGHVAYVGGKRILAASGQNPDRFYTYYFNPTTDGLVAIPGVNYGATGSPIRNGFCLDSDGNVWTSLDKSNAIQLYPLNGFNANGSPNWGAVISTPTPATIAPLGRIEYLPDTDVMVLNQQGSSWTVMGNRIEVYNGWLAGNRTPNRVITLSRAQGKAMAAAGGYLFVGYYAIPNIDVFDLATGALVTSLVSNNTVTVGNDTDSMYGVKAYLQNNGQYLVTKDDYNGCKVVIYRWNPGGVVTQVHTTNVLDPNGHTLIQGTATTIANQTNQTTFAGNVATAYTGNLGGVINFDAANDALTAAPAMVASYGSGGKTLSIGVTAGSVLDIAPLQPTSGTTGVRNCLSAPDANPNQGDITFTMGAITGGVANEKVTSFAFTFLTQTVLNGISVTVTATFSDATTSVVTRTENHVAANPTQDIFYGFVAPAGKSITSVSIVSNTSRAQTTHIDDVGFITSGS